MIDILALVSVLEDENERVFVADIFEKYKNAMYWTAYDVLKNRADAEDAVMKSVENICGHVHDFENLSEKDTKRKVKVIVQNAAIDIYRKNSKENTESIDKYWLASDEDVGSEPEPIYDEVHFREQDFGQLQPHLLKLKEKYKVVLLMKYVDMQSTREIAEKLHIPESTVSTHIHRAKQILKAALENEVKKHGENQ